MPEFSEKLPLKHQSRKALMSIVDSICEHSVILARKEMDFKKKKNSKSKFLFIFSLTSFPHLLPLLFKRLNMETNV